MNATPREQTPAAALAWSRRRRRSAVGARSEDDRADRDECTSRAPPSVQPGPAA
jgi:hypothetical protein